MKLCLLFLSVFVSQNLFSQETPRSGDQTAESNTMEAVLCMPMIAQISQIAHDGGPMSYKLPVFSELLDSKMLEYLEIVKTATKNLGSMDIQTKAQSIYSEISNLRPDLAKACAEFSVLVMGNCATDKNPAECISQRGAVPEIKDAGQKFAMLLKDELMKKTELKTATDLLMPLAEKQESMKATMAQFVANNYFKIIIGLWVIIIGMVVIGVLRFRR